MTSNFSKLLSFTFKFTIQSFNFQSSLNIAPWEMASRWKVIVDDESKCKGVIDEKWKRVAFKTREAMDFDPTPKTLHGQEKIVEHWRSITGLSTKSWSGVVSPRHEWQGSSSLWRCLFAPPGLGTEGTASIDRLRPPSVVLLRCRSYPVMPGAWRTILGYEGFCIDFAAPSYSLGDFASIYTMRKRSPGICYFALSDRS